MQVKAGAVYDNILICDDPEYAKDVVQEIFTNIEVCLGFCMAAYTNYGGRKWDPPSLSCSCVGNFGEFSAPVERDYVRKYVEVNYMEGSDDKKWSKRDFSWSKKLEVCGICTVWLLHMLILVMY